MFLTVGAAARLGLRTVESGLRRTVIAAVAPLAYGAAPFNDAMTRAMARTAPVDVISWRHMYPPVLFGGQHTDPDTPLPSFPGTAFTLDWHRPSSWRHAIERVTSFGAEMVLLPWLHPVMAPSYRYLLRHMPKTCMRVVICHNVAPHERVPGCRVLSRSVLRHADLLVTHAPQQRGELVELRLGDMPILEAFHPRFDADEFGAVPTREAGKAERARHGDPELLLLTFGAIRPYKGVDLALDALAQVDRGLDVRLLVAGRSRGSGNALRDHAKRLRLNGRVEFVDRFIPTKEAARLFVAADASLLPYRSASQSGVAQLSFAYGRPVIATRVGGLPAAVEDGVNGILCDPEAASIAHAIQKLAERRAELTRGVRDGAKSSSFSRYCALIDASVAEQRR
jgi:glycosyltransferase involved in cell wall biosynthesis